MAFKGWFTGDKVVLLPASQTAVFDQFSPAWAAILQFIFMLIVTNKRDLSIFIKIISYGAYFVSLLILTIVGFGIYSFTNTEFSFNAPEQPNFEDKTNDIRSMAMASSGFPSLAGVLCVGFFLHPASVPILK